MIDALFQSHSQIRPAGDDQAEIRKLFRLVLEHLNDAVPEEVKAHLHSRSTSG